MAKNIQIKEHEISTGVSLTEAKQRAQEIFDTVVRPQVENDKKLSTQQKTITLTVKQKSYANCHSPY